MNRLWVGLQPDADVGVGLKADLQQKVLL